MNLTCYLLILKSTVALYEHMVKQSAVLRSRYVLNGIEFYFPASMGSCDYSFGSGVVRCNLPWSLCNNRLILPCSATELDCKGGALEDNVRWVSNLTGRWWQWQEFFLDSLFRHWRKTVAISLQVIPLDMAGPWKDNGSPCPTIYLISNLIVE